MRTPRADRSACCRSHRRRTASPAGAVRCRAHHRDNGAGSGTNAHLVSPASQIRCARARGARTARARAAASSRIAGDRAPRDHARCGSAARSSRRSGERQPQGRPPRLTERAPVAAQNVVAARRRDGCPRERSRYSAPAPRSASAIARSALSSLPSQVASSIRCARIAGVARNHGDAHEMHDTGGVDRRAAIPRARGVAQLLSRAASTASTLAGRREW